MLEFIVVENVGMSLNEILLLRYFWNELNNLEIFLELMCTNPTSLFLVLLMPCTNIKTLLFFFMV